MHIQTAQITLVAAGLLKVPDAGALLRRNDYAGIVRLIDVIQAAMLDRLKGGMCAPRSRGRLHGEGRCLRHLIRLDRVAADAALRGPSHCRAAPALVASKNTLKAPTEEAQKRRKRVNVYSRRGAAFL
ncbi:hypothetical protein [Bradyrhizobium liaoningense]|uniref:hypothetical protein n=1 Tax=Bradyrhizobium liaoningense TaxID=43992 RepID=UPI001BAB9E79|nr:hypothetical protein [Bradyrhizobium liaoningense]MBR0906318.1 hypothetical protein [Bradyrhizobium liaoningense]